MQYTELDIETEEVAPESCIQCHSTRECESCVHQYITKRNLQIVSLQQSAVDHKMLGQQVQPATKADFNKMQISDLRVSHDNRLIAIDSKMRYYDISNIPLFNLYEQRPVDPTQRVVLEQLEVESVLPFKKYPFQSGQDQPMKLHCRRHSVWPLVKLISETGKQIADFELPTRVIYYDIETYRSRLSSESGAPQYHEQLAYIACASLVEQIGDKVVNYIYTLDRWEYDETELKTILRTYRVKGEVHVCKFATETLLALAVLDFFNKPDYLNIAMGYNSSASKERGKGYDLPWILNRANLSINNCVYGRQRHITGETVYTVAMIRGYSHVLFADAMCLFAPTIQGITAKFRRYLDGYKLDDVLQYLEVGSKMPIGSYVEMNKTFQGRGGRATPYLAYCIVDSYRLYEVVQKYNMIDALLAMRAKCQVPLSWLFTCSDASIITAYLTTQYIKSGCTLYYGYLPKLADGNHFGARTSNCPEEYRYMNIPTLDLDFCSQYPSAMLQMNMDHLTVVPTDSEQAIYKLDLNYGIANQKPEMVAFSNGESLLCTILKQWLGEKQAAKRDKHPIIENIIKICINTIYGIFNQQSNPLYRREIGCGTTAFGRFSLWFAMKKFQDIGSQILSVDTDGFGILYDSRKKDKYDDIIQSITSEYQYMVLEQSKPCKFIMPHSSKSYVKPGQLKGIGSLKKHSAKFRGRIEKFFYSLLEVETEDIQQLQQVLLPELIEKQSETKSAPTARILYKHAEKFVAELQAEIFNATELSQLEQFAVRKMNRKHIDGNGRLTTAGYLSRKYGDSDSWLVLPYNTGSHYKDECWISVTDIGLDMDLIQRHRLFLSAVSNINAFFQMKLKVQEPKIRGDTVLVKKQKQTGYDKEIAEYTPQELALELERNGSRVSYHEEISDGVPHKMFFDIESLSHLNYSTVIHALDVIFRGQYGVAIAQAHKIEKGVVVKYSFHVVIQVLCCSAQNIMFAEKLQDLLTAQQAPKCVDTSVYSKKHNLRLPHCVKIKSGVIENRKFKIVAGTFEQMLVTYCPANMQDIRNTIAFSQVPHWNTVGIVRYTPESIQNALQHLMTKSGLKLEYVDNRIVVLDKPYKCPCCSRQHESQDMYFSGIHRVGCYAGLVATTKQYYQLSESYQLVRANSEAIRELNSLPNAMAVNNPLIDFNVRNAKITFIRSAMGTGKTKCLARQFEDYDKVLVISFRKTFATDFSAKTNLKDYQDCDSLSMGEHSRLVAQIDSLHRIRDYQRGNLLLVLDEFESILSQITGFAQQQHIQRSVEVLGELLHIAQSVVVMDAFLTDQSVHLVNQWTNSNNYQCIVNHYTPKRDQTVNIYQHAKGHIGQQYTTNVIDNLKHNRAIFSHCTSYKTAERLVSDIAANMPEKKVLFLHGKNAKVDRQDTSKDAQTHAAFKMQALADVTNWKNYDLVVYTSTLTAGVSFEGVHFATGIHYWSKATTSALEFVQAIGRVRNITETQTVFVEYGTNMMLGPQKPAEFVHEQFAAHSVTITYRTPEQQLLNAYLPARHNNISAANLQFFELFCHMQGYAVVKLEQQSALPIQPVDQQPGILQGVQITIDDVTRFGGNDQRIFNVTGQDAVELETKIAMVQTHLNLRLPLELVNQAQYDKVKVKDQEITVMQFIHANYRTIKLEQQIKNMLRELETEQLQDVSLDSIKSKLTLLITNEQSAIDRGSMYFSPNKNLIQDMIKAKQLHAKMLQTPPEEWKTLFKKLGLSHGVQSVNALLKLVGYKLASKRSNHITSYTLSKLQTRCADQIPELYNKHL